MFDAAKLGVVCILALAFVACRQDGDDPDPPHIVHLDAKLQFTCAVWSDGAVQCWGRGGALGHGEASGTNLGDDEVASAWGLIEAGGAVTSTALAVRAGCFGYASGEVRCWGSGATGLLGNASTGSEFVLPSERPPVALLDEVTMLGNGAGRVCALLVDQRVQCWGFNEDGVLGYGHTQNIGDDELPNSAGALELPGKVIQVVLGDAHVCALREDGRVLCWGEAAYGQPGQGNTDTIGDDETLALLEPIELAGSPISHIAAGSRHSCAIHREGEVSCWGSNGFGELGHPGGANVGDDELPASVGHVDVGGKAIDVTAGQHHSCALLEGGGVRCWGDAFSGELGLASVERIGDDETPASAPLVRLSQAAVAIAAGSKHTCALLEGGGVQCWGANEFGQLGYGHTDRIGDDEHPDTAGLVPLR